MKKRYINVLGRIMVILLVLTLSLPRYSAKAFMRRSPRERNMESSQDIVINIPDDKLREVINKTLDKDRKIDEKITKNDMESIKEIISDDKIGYLNHEETAEPKEIHDRGIRSIEGLEYAINLEKLDLSENRISDLEPLKNLKKLTHIDLDRNMLGDLTPLSKLNNLTRLNIYNNANIVDTEPLSHLKNLKWLDMHFCNRRTASVKVDGLGKLENLEFLSIDDNFIEDISFAENLTKLTSFSCNNNYVMDLTPVQDLAVSAYNDWTGDAFFNMFGQGLKRPINISVKSEGGVYKINVPAVKNKAYEEKVKSVAKEYGEEVNVPGLD
ncbi:leucine-rich repeat domain-containing protein, partial [Clostridium sp.]|uniref:leucine-rich repeat domain-containing protein n=1 Tax=Clostridium sp. TaxID=1506 RepID=UPI003463F45B